MNRQMVELMQHQQQSLYLLPPDLRRKYQIAELQEMMRTLHRQQQSWAKVTYGLGTEMAQPS